MVSLWSHLAMPENFEIVSVVRRVVRTAAEDFETRIHAQSSQSDHVLLVCQRNKQFDSEDRQHFRMELMPEVLAMHSSVTCSASVDQKRDNIFGWSLCQKYYLALGDQSAVQIE